MARLFPSPKFRAFDAQGNPLAGGKLYTYINDTTSDKDSYTDADEGTTNANPVVLDANGEANVWLSETGGYKLKLTDSSDVEQWTVNDIFENSITSIALQDNTTNAFLIKQGSDNYLQIKTNDTTESIIFGNTSVAPIVNFIVKDGTDDVFVIKDSASSELINMSTNDTTALLTIGGGTPLKTTFTIKDNTASAFTINNGSNVWFDFTTTNSSETIQIGNATDNPAITLAGTGAVSVEGALTVTGLLTANGGVTLGAGDDLIGSSTSDITIATDKFTVAGATGNTVVGGTLQVDGNTTLGDNSAADVTVTFDSAASNGIIKWDNTLEEFNFDKDVTMDGTLDVTGVSTLNSLTVTTAATLSGDVYAANIKTGATQGAAGAAAGELWADSDDDYTVKLGQ